MRIMKNMKKSLALICASLVTVALAVFLAGCSSAAKDEQPAGSSSGTTATAPENPTIRLSTTTSVNDSGLLPFLQPFFEEETGYTLEITSAGTGAAIKKGETGDADLLLVHAKASEEEFIAKGYGVERIPFMYNYFVIVGPADDPAGVSGCATAAEAFAKIAASEQPFVSRGDDSGTNKKELQIWADAGIDPSGSAWYANAGAGMGATLTMAAEQSAYTLTDKGTFLSHAAKDSLSIVLSESDDMKNTYSLIAVSPDKWPDVNAEGANAFITWMTSSKAFDLIAQYGEQEYGEPLFYVML